LLRQAAGKFESFLGLFLGQDIKVYTSHAGIIVRLDPADTGSAGRQGAR
jgi:hypothetical protein